MTYIDVFFLFYFFLLDISLNYAIEKAERKGAPFSRSAQITQNWNNRHHRLLPTYAKFGWIPKNSRRPVSSIISPFAPRLIDVASVEIALPFLDVSIYKTKNELSISQWINVKHSQVSGSTVLYGLSGFQDEEAIFIFVIRDHFVGCKMVGYDY